jgi:H+/Cl- antiporter ClcA
VSTQLYDDVDIRGWIRSLVVAGVLGIPVALAAVLFMSLTHGAQELLWHDIPDAFDRSTPPGWYVIAVTAVGGALVAAALRLPGGGGHPAIEGLSVHPTPPRELAGLLAAAFASIACGLVVGPEAPLIAIGLAVGALGLRAIDQSHGPALAVAGAFAAIATLLGGPIVASLMLFELITIGRALPAGGATRLLLPGFVAAGTGAIVFNELAEKRGIDIPALAVPGLPDYPDTRWADLAWTIPLAVAATLAVLLARMLANELWARAAKRPMPYLIGGGAAVGAVAVVFRALADRPVDFVLFSGQGSLADTIAEGSAWVVALIVVAKALGYGLSLGAGFRGGIIFPAIAIGVAVGTLAADVLPGLDLTPAVVVGIAAGTAGAVPAPFTAALMAVLLVGAGAVAALPIAIFAAATGWLLVVAVLRRKAADATADPEP